MYPYLITTDSGCDLTAEYCDNIGVIPYKMQFTMNGVPELDTMTHEGNKSFYDRMREGVTPATSQINPSQYIEFWKPLLDEGKPILHIAMGSGISGTYANALTARDIIRDEDPDVEIIIVDSTLASVGYGMLAMVASEERDKGTDIHACAKKLDEIKGNINTIYTTSDLTYLQRGGRVSKVGAVIGTVLNINPILDLDIAGHLKVFDKVRGDKGAKRKVISMVQELIIEPENQTLVICHSDFPERAKDYGDTLMSLLPFKDVFYTEIGPTIGAHAGPGLVAAFFYGQPRPEQ